MDESFLSIALKSFRGGIAPDGDKGPVGSFKFARGMDIHGGKDTLKPNQALKQDALGSGESFEDLPIAFVSASDSNKYAFGDTGICYRRKDDEWMQTYDFNSRVSGAIEFKSTSDRFLLIATVDTLYKIPLRIASVLDDWTGHLTEVGDFAGEVEATPNFSATYGTTPNYSYWFSGLINPTNADFSPAITAYEHAQPTSSSSSVTLSITVPDQPDQVLIVIAGDFTSGSGPTGATTNGLAMTSIGGGAGASGALSVNNVGFRYLNPIPGSHSIVVTLQSARTNRFIHAFVVSGVSQVTPVAGVASGFDPATQTNSEATRSITDTAEHQAKFGFLLSTVTTFTEGVAGTLMQQGTTGSAGSHALFFKAFQKVESDHPMQICAGSAMILDGNYLAMYDFEDAFNTQALTLPPGIQSQTILNQASQSVDLAIMGCIEQGNDRGWMITWDGQADSWLSKKPVKDAGVNAMGFLEGGIVLITGSKGTAKYFDFADVYPIKTIPGTLTSHPGAYAEFRALSHFGMNGGTKNGVYSIGRVDKNRPIALNLEYVPSFGLDGVIDMENGEIGVLGADSTDLFVGWKYTDNSGMSPVITYGMDIIDHDNKAVAVYESLELDMGKAEQEKLVSHIKALLSEALPADTTVEVKIKSTSQPDWADTEMSDGRDAIDAAGDTKGIFDTEAKGEIIEIQVILTPDENDAPEVQAVIASFNFQDSI